MDDFFDLFVPLNANHGSQANPGLHAERETRDAWCGAVGGTSGLRTG